MRILQNYISQVVIAAILIVSLTLLGIETFMEFINELPDIGKQNYGIIQAITYVAMQLPADLYQLFPVAGFLGGLLGLGRLANNSELIIMRASGVSIIRITWVVAKTALILLLVIALIGEGFAPKLQYQASVMKLNALKKQPEADQKELWVRHNNTFLHIGRILSSNSVQDIVSYEFDPKGNLLKAISAKNASFQPSGWQLNQVEATEFEKNKTTTQHLAQMILQFSLKPTSLLQLNRDPDEQNLFDLWDNIEAHHRAGLIATRFELNFWQRILQPLTILVLICIGVPFIFGSLRQTSTSGRMLIGISIGFIFYMINRFIGPLTLVYQWPPWLVAAFPTFLFMMLGIYLLCRVK